MIEKHYLQDQIIRQYEFDFGFCVPKTRTSAEFIYDLPRFEEEDMEYILVQPWLVTSDSFFFADQELIIHNKAAYDYTKQ